MKIAIGSDHAGFKLKTFLKTNFREIDWVDVGTFSEDSVDYPDFAHALAAEIEQKNAEFGVLICGTGNGINMTINKYAFIRAALCWNTEIVALARAHNNANVLSLPGRFVEKEQAKQMLETFLNTPFEGGRHQNRINKINKNC